jgi:PAT family beta-lactamase induction signal transducer AmpG
VTTDAKPVKNPLWWVPSSYLAEGIPFAMVVWVAGTMFKDLGHSDSEITLYTGGTTIVWSLKPFYAGFLDMMKTKKFWVLAMEILMAGLLGLWAFSLALPNYFMVIVLLLWLVAFASATQDICVDGVYITSLDKSSQGKYIGLQGAFWVTGRIFATALVVGIASFLQTDGHTWNPGVGDWHFEMTLPGPQLPAKAAWTMALGVSMVTMALLAVYHFFMLPTGSTLKRPESAEVVFKTFWDQILDFVKKPQLLGMILFVFLFRLGEGFLLVEAPLFMQGKITEGGLGMCATQALSAACPHTLGDKALIDGGISTVVSLLFGLLGGWFAGRKGLSTKTLVFMALCLNIPHVTFLILAQMATPEAPVSLPMIATLVTIEKAGYSFGFVANMLYMMQQISPGKYHMTHYAFCTAIMNLTLLPTQMASGWLAERLGFLPYFWVVMAASIPSVVGAYFAPFPHKVEPGQAAGLAKH